MQRHVDAYRAEHPEDDECQNMPREAMELEMDSLS